MAGDLNRSVKIYIDNSDAMLKADQLKDKVKTLSSELEKLAATQGKDSDAYKKKEKAYDSAVKSLNTYEKKVKETERVLKNLSKATYDELIRAKKELVSALRKAERGTDDYRNKLLLLRQANKQIAEVTKEMQSSAGRQGDWWCRAADGFNKYVGLIGAGIATLTGVSMKFRQLAADVAQMDDVYADVMKTTGMTRDQVKDLNEVFKKMDTRTAREELNNLARDAGKLGLSSKKDVLDFVEAGNQINVALGEDLGEGAIKNIGKITEVYKNSTKELDQMDLKGRMLSVGSAINELGQSSTASEAYLVNFTQRLGGVASQANISVQNILGYASGLDQSAQTVEMSATAFQNFIMKLMGDPAKFARIAGLEVSKFTKLLKTDTNQAIITVMEALNNKGGFQQLIPLFKDMGLDGARAAGVLSSMASNIHRVKEAQDISNRAFSEGISVTKEYSVKNNNLQAELEKKQKAFKEAALELGERLNPALLKSTSAMTALVKVMPAVLDFFAKYGKYMLYAVTVIALYNAGIKLQTAYKTALHGWRLKEIIAIQAEIYWTKLARITVLLYNATIALLTGNITRAKAAMHLLNLVIKANPVGRLVAVIGAVVIGLIELVKYIRGASSELDKFRVTSEQIKEATEQYTSSIRKEHIALQTLIGAILSVNEKSDLRKKLIEQLKTEYPQYLSFVDSEKISNEKLLAILEDINDQYEKKTEIALMQGKTDAYTTSITKRQERQVEIEQRIVTLNEDGLTGDEKDEIKDLEKEFQQLARGIEYAGQKIAEFKAQQKEAEEQLKYENSLEGIAKEMNVVLHDLRTEEHYLSKLKEKVSKGLMEETDAVYIAQEKRLSLLNAKYDVLLDKQDALVNNPKTADTPTSTDTPTPEAKESKVKAAFDLQLKALENNYRRRQLIIQKNDEKEWTTEQEKQRVLSDAEYDYLYERTSLMKNFQTSHAKLSSDIENKRLEDELKLQENHRKFEQSLLDGIRKTEKKELDRIQASADAERSSLKTQYDSGIITQEQYNARILLLDHNTAYARLEVLRGTGDALKELTLQNEDLKTNAVEQSGKEIVAAEQKTQEAVAALKKNYLESDKTILEQYGKTSIEQQKKQELDRIRAMRNHTVKDEKGNDVADPLISAETAKAAELAIEKKYEDQKLKVRQEYGIASMNEIHRSELDALKEKLDQELLTEEEYAAAKTQLKLKHAKEYADKAGEFIQAGSELVQALSEAETASVEAEYTERQSALTEQYNQGILSQEEYNEQKEQLDYEQKVKELEVQKKYADVMFAMQTAQIVATTAQGVMNAWASANTYPFPYSTVVGVAMTALLAATSIAQIARAKAERDKVKSMSIESPGGGSTPTGARVLNQAAKGRYDVIGDDDGKLYRDVPYAGTPVTGIVSTPTIVAETGSELIVSAPDLKRLEKHVNYPLIVSAINDARAGTLPQRAAGNYAPLPAADTSAGTSTGRSDESGNDISAALQDIRNFLHDLKSGVNIKAKASVSLTDLKAAQELEAKATKTFAKN
jgi:TP901 family phage tail tape measure protein